jgi:hypothetical protein
LPEDEPIRAMPVALAIALVAVATALVGWYKAGAGDPAALERWLGRGLTTTLAVGVIVALDGLAQRRQIRWLEAVLVIVAPIALVAAGGAAYWPGRHLIALGWYISVDEIASWWGILCGAPAIVVGHVWNRRRAA